MYLKFRYEYIEVEDVLESEEIGKWNVNQYLLLNFKKYGKKSIE